MFERFDDILTVEELAEALRLSTTYAYKLVRNQIITAFKEGKDWKIPKQSLIEYVASRSRTS